MPLCLGPPVPRPLRCLNCAASEAKKASARSHKKSSVAARVHDNAPDRSSNLATPLLDAVKLRGSRTQETPFHIPGHKRGQGAPQQLLEVVTQDTLRHDLTELKGLDYLSSPTGVIAEAQTLAAAAFGADATWFLVNGTTVGIQAAVLATCGPNDTLLVARNCHMSAFSAMVLAGCAARYVQPITDEAWGVAHGVTAQAVQEALASTAAEGRHVGAVLMVSPTYYGVTSPLAEIAACCHAHGVPLIVDEAHGGHFVFHASSPQPALAADADIAVQSTHKVLGSMGQSSMLHARGPLVDAGRITKALTVLQSSSPSYLLLASLDAARGQAQQPATWQQPVEAARLARAGIRNMVESGHPLRLLGEADVAAHGMGIDPLRLTVAVDGLGMTGYQADAILEERYGVVAELCTQQLVVFALGPGTTVAHATALLEALQGLCGSCSSRSEGPRKGSRSRYADFQEKLRSRGGRRAVMTEEEFIFQYTKFVRENVGGQLQELAEARLTPREAFFAATEVVPVAAAAGRVSAELLCPYPPGVPVVFPGELVTAAALTALQLVLQQGGTVTGCADRNLGTLRVVTEMNSVDGG